MCLKGELTVRPSPPKTPPPTTGPLLPRYEQKRSSVSEVRGASRDQQEKSLSPAIQYVLNKLFNIVSDKEMEEKYSTWLKDFENMHDIIQNPNVDEKIKLNIMFGYLEDLVKRDPPFAIQNIIIGLQNDPMILKVKENLERENIRSRKSSPPSG